MEEQNVELHGFDQRAWQRFLRFGGDRVPVVLRQCRQGTVYQSGRVVQSCTPRISFGIPECTAKPNDDLSECPSGYRHCVKVNWFFERGFLGEKERKGKREKEKG